LASALSDGQVATAEMVTLSLEKLIANNPILLDILGNPHMSLKEAFSMVTGNTEPLTQTQRIENNTNVIVPVLEENLNIGAIEIDLERQLNGSTMHIEPEPQPTAEPRVLRRSSTTSSSLANSQSQTGSQFDQQAFDAYLNDILPSQQSQSQSQQVQSPVFKNFITQPSTPSADIEIDFNYINHYLTNMTSNVMEIVNVNLGHNQSQSQNTLAVINQLPVINRYLSLPAPSPPSVLTEVQSQGHLRVRIIRPRGLSMIRGRNLTNRRLQRAREELEEEQEPTLLNQGLYLLRNRLRRLVSRVVANSVEMDVINAPDNLRSDSQ
jgi:hypothetical protein